MAGAPPQNRMAREQRVEQLLDVTARLLTEQGLEAVTMEGVAAAAGVSKALPYRHFDNRDELLAALFEREVRLTEERISGAIAGADRLEEKVATAVHALFDTIVERGALLTVFVHAPTVRARLREHATTTHHRIQTFFARLFATEVGLDQATATVAASILLASVPGALSSWLRAEAPRQRIEDILVAVVVGGLERLVTCPQCGEPVPTAGARPQPDGVQRTGCPACGLQLVRRHRGRWEGIRG